MEQKTCRVCLAPGHERDPLTHPCPCKGTQWWIHQGCVIRTMESREGSQKCPTCHGLFGCKYRAPRQSTSVHRAWCYFLDFQLALLWALCDTAPFIPIAWTSLVCFLSYTSFDVRVAYCLPPLILTLPRARLTVFRALEGYIRWSRSFRASSWVRSHPVVRPEAGQRLCYICCNPGSGTLVDPCKCLDSTRWVHVKCIQNWVRTSGKHRCAVCTTDFAGHRRHWILCGVLLVLDICMLPITRFLLLAVHHPFLTAATWALLLLTSDGWSTYVSASGAIYTLLLVRRFDIAIAALMMPTKADARLAAFIILVLFSYYRLFYAMIRIQMRFQQWCGLASAGRLLVRNMIVRDT